MLEELSAKVRSGEINPIDLVNESLRRIEAAKPLNAVVAVYADEARSLATYTRVRGHLLVCRSW